MAGTLLLLLQRRHVTICHGQQLFRVVEFQQFHPFPIAKIGRIEEEQAVRECSVFRKGSKKKRVKSAKL